MNEIIENLVTAYAAARIEEISGLPCSQEIKEAEADQIRGIVESFTAGMLTHAEAMRLIAGGADE